MTSQSDTLWCGTGNIYTMVTALIYSFSENNVLPQQTVSKQMGTSLSHINKQEWEVKCQTPSRNHVMTRIYLIDISAKKHWLLVMILALNDFCADAGNDLVYFPEPLLECIRKQNCNLSVK